MKYAVDSEQMKKIDDYSVKVCKIPALELMERAAMEVVAVMKNRILLTDRILAVCGPGNNGGDGVAAGRILYLQGYHVAILFIGNEEKSSAAMKIQLEKARNIGIPFENSNKLHEYNIIIDAIFGVGLSREVTGKYKEIIQSINDNDQTVYSVDVPSGISSDDGKVMNVAIKADETITFGHQKLGLLLYPGAEYAGNITVADIGFPKEATNEALLHTFYYEPEDLLKLPPRKNYSNKGTYGKVLIIAGCKGMSGAAYLSAKAAYRTGSGLVRVLTSEENRIILQTSLPEAIFSSYDEENLNKEKQQEKILEALRWATVIVIGPGLGLSKEAAELVDFVLMNANVPLIVDADGITLLANKLDYLLSFNEPSDFLQHKDKIQKQCTILEETTRKRLNCLSGLLKEDTILTPHLKELSRLIGVTVTEITNNLIDTAHQCSYNNELIYAIKDARSIVTQSNKSYINVSGNNGMATGGSGDVLTGIIAAFIAQGMAAYDAACLGIYVHGLAGDTAANEMGFYSLMASDIVNSIEKVIRGKGKR